MQPSQIKPLFLSIIAALALNAAPVMAAGTGTGTPQGSCPSVTTSAPVSAEDAASLSFMREEEKLAYDVYQSLAAQWPETSLFANISASEQTHMHQIKCLLDAFGLTDPAPTVAGQFSNPDLQNLYDDLSARGAVSVVEALRVGALIEETDIADLTAALATTQVPEIQAVYENLRKASGNHLRAFVGQLSQLGETYRAQVLDAVALTAAMTPPPPPSPVFNFDNLGLHIPAVRLSQGGQLLPPEETYQLELRLTADGSHFQVVNLQRAQQPTAH